MPTIEKKYFYTLDEYQKDAMRTDTAHLDGMDGITNALMGINGEAGEAIDILKKHLYQGAELDMEHLIKEVGDVLWYCAQFAKYAGVGLNQIAEYNIMKLRARYPKGFEAERSANRAVGDV